jgi:hypothetical protein
MNTTKIERIQKQIQKIKNKKDTLILNLDETYKYILNYILKHKTYINYQKINTLLNKDNSLSKYIQVVDSESDEDINISQLYANMLIYIKELSEKEISNQEIIDIDQKIVDKQNQILYGNNRKTKLNDQKKKLTTDYINIPTKLLQNLVVEKTNIFNVINRIELLEELNNNEFFDNFKLIYLDNNSLQKDILFKKNEIKGQNKIINQMKEQNLKCRQDTVKRIQKFKQSKKNIEQEKNKLNQHINNIHFSINKNINNMNKLKLEIRLSNQQLNEDNYQVNKELIDYKLNQIRVIKKKVDYLNLDKNRHLRELSNYIKSLNENLDKPKVITKHEISQQKNKLCSLISELNNLNSAKDNNIRKQKELILDNMLYNIKLNEEFERSEERLIIISKRIDNSLTTNKIKLIKELEQIDNKIGVEDQNKIKNLEDIETLNNTKKTKFRDLYFLKEKIIIINKIKKSITDINVDLNSYEKIIK